MSDLETRQAIIEGCRSMERAGLNRGSSGNISVRDGSGMLVTPSAVPYPDMQPEMIARLELDDDSGAYQGPKKPSTEWRFHRDLLRARPEFNAIVHSHARYCTILAIARQPIPAVHYMMAAFGGPDIRVADYACYGTAALSANVVKAMEGRAGALMANHGMIVGADSLTRALWLAAELEALADQYYHTLLIGGPCLLTEADLAETAKGFARYGAQDLKQGRPQ